MPVALFGLSYKTAPLDLREAVSFDAESLSQALPGLTCEPSVREAVVVSTCHRTEIYTELTDMVAAKEHAMSWLADQRGLSRRAFGQHVYHRFERDAVEHLFRVAAGLESMVLGEDQILGQVREAFKIAGRAGTVRTRLDTTFRRALRVGKRARTETNINRHSASIGSVAADLARQALGSLEDKRTVVIGAGEMAELAARHLLRNGASDLVVVNRSQRRGEALAAKLGVTSVALSDVSRLLAEADIAITSTGSHDHLVTADMLADREQPLVIIDLGLPRDVEPAAGELPNVRLYNVDQLDEVLAGQEQAHAGDVARVEQIVAEELLDWDRWHASLGVVPTISALTGWAEDVRDRETSRTLGRLSHLSERDRQEVAALAQAVTRKLLHGPIDRLKSGALPDGYLDVARDLFGLED
ncbi:MAG TPA: glutamyl-tRNA reductase [Chloroflexota bacterium]|nr:glutamyl-tRNA reductase [Chloroflexota bacterium]